MRCLGEPSVFEPCALDDLDRVVAYMEAAPVVSVAAGKARDRVSGAVEVPIGVASDGVFVWPLALTWYASRHRVAPPAELVDHIRGRGYVVDAVDVDGLRRDLRGPDPGGDSGVRVAGNGWGDEPG
jgi:hypothetical protein